MMTARDTDYRQELATLTPGLRQFARALVHDHAAEVADDLVQATLVRALAADQRRRGERLVIWLMAVLTGLHRSQASELSADHKLTAGSRGGKQAGRRAGWDLSRTAVRDGTTLLSGVPLECREVLLLVTLVRLSYAQVAEALGVSITTVMERLSRARDHLGPGGFGEAPARPAGADLQGKRRAVPHLRLVK